MTEKLYYKNAYAFDFEARVVETVTENGRSAVILDRTCFYPEGGGQPADHGWLNDIPVYDVQLRGEEVLHFVEKPLKPGRVKGRVDVNRRLDFMQQHTGQHIISRALLQVGNYATYSVHFGDEYTSIEIDAPEIPEHQLQQVEELSNEVVHRNLSVKIHWVAPEEVNRFPIRKPPPDVSLVRIVEIDRFDFSTCGGTHLLRTGEVGLIKVVGTEKLRGHVRIKFKIGKRAIADYDSKIRLVRQLMQSLTCGEEEISGRVSDLQQQVKNLQKQIGRLQQEHMSLLAAEAGQNARKIGEIELVTQTFRQVDSPALRSFVHQLIEEPNRIVAVVNRDDHRLQWVVGHSLGERFDLTSFVRPLLSAMDARGGGRGNMVQGGGNNPAGIPEFFKQLQEKIERELKI